MHPRQTQTLPWAHNALQQALSSSSYFPQSGTLALYIKPPILRPHPSKCNINVWSVMAPQTHAIKTVFFVRQVVCACWFSALMLCFYVQPPLIRFTSFLELCILANALCVLAGRILNNDSEQQQRTKSLHLTASSLAAAPALALTAWISSSSRSRSSSSSSIGFFSIPTREKLAETIRSRKQHPLSDAQQTIQPLPYEALGAR